MTIIDRFCEYDGKKVNIFEICSGLILVSDSSLKQKCELFVQLFDTNKNYMIGRNELIFLFRCCIRAISIFMQESKSPKTTEITSLVDELSKRDRRFSENGISTQDFLRFVLNTSIILEFLRNFGLFMSEEFAYNFGENKLRLMYHEYFEAEIKRLNTCYSKEYLKYRKGDRSLKDNLSSNVQKDFESLSNSIKRLEPKYGVKTKRKALKTFRPEREHVYGFRCYDIRDNIILNPNDKLFYTSGSMVISIDLNKEETQQIDNDGDIIFEVVPKEQKIFDNHSTSVQSFDMYVEENNTSSMIASCEGSAENNIIIWDSDTFEVKASLKNYFELGVSKVKFSNNCKFIAVIGRSAEDSQHLAVFNYSKIETFLKSGRKDDKLEFLLSIGSKPVSDMTFDHLDQSIYFTNGESLCKYKIYGDKGLQTLAWQSKLNRSGNANSEFLTCILCPPGRPVLTTTIKGSIYSWDAGFKEISGAHQSAINCFERIDYMQATYGTGSDDGLIKFWTPDLLLVYSIDLMLVYSQMPNTINPSVTHLKYRNGTLVFSTRGGYIYKSTLPPGFQAPDDLEESKYGDQKEKVTLSKHTEQNTVSSQISIVIESVVKGISDQYVTGAALSFISPEIYIIGTNNVLMHWNYKKKSLVKQKKIEYPTKLLTTSQNGNFIAIGCKNGSVLLLSATTFEILFTHSCEKREITSITFSTSNENLAIGYDNGVLEVLSTPMNFKMVMNIRNVNMDPITSLDFSEDNLYLRATFSDMNICLYDVSKYKIMTPHEYGKLAQESWGQWTSSVGYQVQGIWGEYDSELDILGANRSSNKDILAIWDKYGGVKLFRYPCLFFDDPFIRLSQTGGDTSIVLFNYNSTHMFVVGKNDSCIVQYKLNYDEFDPKYNDDNNYNSKVEKEKRNVETIRTKDKDRPDRYLKHLPLLYPSNFDHKEIISQSYTGLNFEMIESVGLNLENIKRPIVSVNEETLIYCSGTNLVRCSLPDQEKYKKKMYFHFHNKPISMIEVSKSRNLIATSEFIDILDGEADQTAKIIIHDFTKQEIISEMWMEKNESCIFAKFSPNEDILVAVTNKPGVGNRLIVLDWANALQIQSFPCGKATICELCFKNDSQFATVSTFQVIFWKLNGVKLEQKYGVYKDVEQEFDNTSATYAFEKSLFFTGHSKGTIGCWQNDELKSEVSGHQGKAVLLMRRHQNDTLFTAGADGVIVRWGYSTLLQRIGPVYEVRESSLREKMGFLSINPSLNDMIIITETGDIIRTGTKTLPKIIMSEVTAQISSICYIDTHRILIVSTYDGRVIEVSFTNKATGPIRQTINSGTFYTAMAYLSDIERIVVSDNKGMLYILKKALDGEESQLASSFTQPSNSVILLKPSPDLRKMIVGSNGGGGKIEVIRIESNRLKRDSIVNLGLAGGILSVDWDKDSAIIFVNTSEGEIKSYNILKGIFLKAVEIRDIEWNTFTSPFSFYAGGLHRNPDGTSDITSVCTRKGFPFIIAGTRNGEVSCFNIDIR